MIRSALAIASGLLCAMVGFRAASDLIREASALTRWSELTAHMNLLLEQATLPLPGVLRAAATGDSPPDRILLAVAAMLTEDPMTSPHEAFRRAVQESPGADALLRMAARLGRGDAQSRSLACLQASQELTRLAQEAQRRAASDVKLLRTLGGTIGACLTLLLI